MVLILSSADKTSCGWREPGPGLFSLFTHAALDIFEFGQDVEGEAISLASGSISAIHEVTKGQN